MVIPPLTKLSPTATERGDEFHRKLAETEREDEFELSDSPPLTKLTVPQPQNSPSRSASALRPPKLKEKTSSISPCFDLFPSPPSFDLSPSPSLSLAELRSLPSAPAHVADWSSINHR